MREQEMYNAQQRPASNDSRTNRFSLGRLIIILAIADIFAGTVWLIPDTELARGGIRVQGTIVNVDQGGCGGRRSEEPVSVQFTDQAGQVHTSTFSQCDYGTSYVNPGASITIVYLPNNPTVIAPLAQLPSNYQAHAVIIVGIGLIELPLLSVWIVRRIRKQRRARSASSPAGNKLSLSLTRKEEIQ